MLDKGWFTAAASRAMIIHSRMFSDYVENEEIVTHEGLTTVCNELPRYADTQTFSIKVVDQGKPVSGVTLRIELLNYSEFFPISTLISDENGEASITLGLGDLHIHAVKEMENLLPVWWIPARNRRSPLISPLPAPPRLKSYR